MLQEAVQETPTVPSQEVQLVVSPPTTHVPTPTIQDHIEEPPVHFAQQTGEQQLPSPSQPSAPQDHVPSSTSTPSEWHRHGSTSEQPSSLVPDSTLPDSSILFRLISAQFSTLQSKLESKFVVLENKVDTKLNQLQVHLERHITEYAYNYDTKMHHMEKDLSD